MEKVFAIGYTKAPQTAITERGTPEGGAAAATRGEVDREVYQRKCSFVCKCTCTCTWLRSPRSRFDISASGF